MYDGEALECEREPTVGVGLDLAAELQPLVSLGSQKTGHVASVLVVDVLDASVAEGQLPHPVYATAHASGQAETRSVGCRNSRARLEAIRREVVVAAVDKTQNTLDTLNGNCTMPF